MTLVVAGDGERRAELAADAERRKLPTEFLGWLAPAARNVELRRADALLFPSRWPEPFGLSGIEAGCFGVPAVGFGVGGSVDWLRPGVSGEVAAGRTPADLGAALARLLSDPAEWQRRRRGAWEAAKEFTSDRHLSLLLPALKKAAAESRS